MAKYKTLKDLANGFKNGELDGWVLSLDNDNTSLSWRGGNPDDIDPDDFDEQKYDEGRSLYDGHDDTYILPQALDLAGIPNEEV